jgi:RNA polymerase sigma-70 factor (ECF subfamily)
MRPNSNAQPVEYLSRLASRANDDSAGAHSAGARELDFVAIVVAHGRALHGRALWLTKKESDAADLFQDTIERALAASHKQRDPALVLRWLLTIMHNTFLDDCRARITRRTVSDSDAVLEQIAWEAPAKPPRWRTVTDDVVGACIARLPRHMQEIFRMYAAGASYVTLANHFQIPGSTVGTRLLRMRRRLRRLLRDASVIDNPL